MTTPALFRASSSSTQVLADLGPLSELLGTWVGNGLNLISLPDKHDSRAFRLKLNSTHEILSFTSIGAPISNRGSAQDDIAFLGLHYFQQVSDAVSNEGLHVELGLWLNLPTLLLHNNQQPWLALAPFPMAIRCWHKAAPWSRMAAPKLIRLIQLPSLWMQ